MNANELADELEKRHLLGGYASQAATMLRQQQAQIEALKEQTTKLKLEWQYMYGRANMEQKPLSKKEIADLEYKHIEFETFDEGEYGTEYNIYGVEEFARAIERAHGIGDVE